MAAAAGSGSGSSSRRRRRGGRNYSPPSFSLWRSSRDDSISARDYGRITYNPRTRKLQIVTKRYSSYIWQDISLLSKTKFEEHQTNINNCMRDLASNWASTNYEDVIDDEVVLMSIADTIPSPQQYADSIDKGPTLEGDDFALLTEIYDTLSQEKKTELKEKYKNTTFMKKRCSCCDSFMQMQYKCIHSDCVGMCKTCHGNSIASGVECCPACKKEQKLECPICTDTKKPDEMLMGKRCPHGICLACFADSYRCGKAITKCPMCRCKFH